MGTLLAVANGRSHSLGLYPNTLDHALACTKVAPAIRNVDGQGNSHVPTSHL